VPDRGGGRRRLPRLAEGDHRCRRGLAHKPINWPRTRTSIASGRRAIDRLLGSGVGGPFGLALGREQYTRVVETAEHGGYPLLNHLRKILEGPIAWAPGVNGAVVLSLRGGDFVFDSGQDTSVGYDSHDADTVRLYLEESFSFHVATPEAALALAP
jgi:uncharacterized linocin/CFP29 family protein